MDFEKFSFEDGQCDDAAELHIKSDASEIKGLCPVKEVVTICCT